MQTRVVLLVPFLLLVSLSLSADAPGVYALTGATVHTVRDGVVEGGTVVIRRGLIESVGRNVRIPADATVIDLTGSHIYPGLFDAQTSLGLPAPPPSRTSTPGAPAAPAAPAETPQPNARIKPSPSFIVAEALTISDDAMQAKRATGVTTVLVAPTSGILQGQTAIVNLTGDTEQGMILKTPASLQVAFSPNSWGTFPDSLMGVIAHVRQTLYDAQQSAAAQAAYQRNPGGKLRPRRDPNLDALAPVLQKSLPIVFLAETEEMAARAAAIAREFGVRWILSGGRESHAMASMLAASRTPVLLSVNFPRAPSERQEDQPIRLVRQRVLAPTSGAALAKAGVPFALVSAGTAPADFIAGVRKVIAAGLDPAAALRAVTLSPAEIFGVERQIGSLTAGKIANVVVTDKPIFDREARVSRLFVDGREVRLPREEDRKDAAASPLEGTWNVVVRMPEGDVPLQIVLQVQESRITGTFSGDRGAGDIRGGSVEGDRFSFTFTAQTTRSGETSDWRFEGTIREGTIEGTVSMTVGTFPFTGRKPQ